MNEIERADTIRGFKALLLLFGIPLVFFAIWPSTGELFHSALIILCLAAAAAWGLWRYRKRRSRQVVKDSSTSPFSEPPSSTPPSSTPPFSEPLSSTPPSSTPPFSEPPSPTPSISEPASLFERYKETIEAYKSRVSLSDYRDDNLIRDCITNIAQHEGRTNIAPGSVRLYKWERWPYIPDEYRRLAEQLKTEFRKKAEESKKTKDEQVALKAEKMLTANWDLVEKFLDIAERKVSVLDDYGDEQWDVLPDEVFKLLKKICEREGDYLTGEWGRTTKKLGITNFTEEYQRMATRLQLLFQEHHEKVKSKSRDETEFQSLSGVEFETYIAKLLRSAGYEVQGTPTTGDQGADLIAKKGGRTIIVQAKRYQGAVGNKAVQEVSSAVSFYGGDEGWVVTNSTFTPSAIALAQKTNIKLIDGVALRSRSIF